MGATSGNIFAADPALSPLLDNPVLVLFLLRLHLFGKVDVRLPGKGNGARPVHLIITMIK